MRPWRTLVSKADSPAGVQRDPVKQLVESRVLADHYIPGIIFPGDMAENRPPDLAGDWSSFRPAVRQDPLHDHIAAERDFQGCH